MGEIVDYDFGKKREQMDKLSASELLEKAARLIDELAALYEAEGTVTGTSSYIGAAAAAALVRSLNTDPHPLASKQR